MTQNDVVADPRCWPYTNNETFDFNGSFPASYQDFLHSVPIPSGIHGNFSPQYANIATQFATFSTSIPSTQSVIIPSTATVISPTDTASLFLRPETTTLSNTAFVGVLTSSSSSSTSSSATTTASKIPNGALSRVSNFLALEILLTESVGRTRSLAIALDCCVGSECPWDLGPLVKVGWRYRLEFSKYTTIRSRDIKYKCIEV